MNKLGLKSICLLEDKQDKQYAVVGYARVRNPNTELSTTSKVACRKRTFQKQRIMMLKQDQCDFLKSASMAYYNGKENASFNSGTLLLETIGMEICPKEPCFLVSITELGLKSICLLEDKQDKQYAVVGYARV